MFSAMTVQNIELALTSWDAKEIDIYLKDKL